MDGWAATLDSKQVQVSHLFGWRRAMGFPQYNKCAVAQRRLKPAVLLNPFCMFMLSTLFPELHPAATMSPQLPSQPGVLEKKIIMQRLCALSNIIAGLCARREGLVVSVGSCTDRAGDIWEGRRCSNANALFKEGAIKHSWHLFNSLTCSGGVYSCTYGGRHIPALRLEGFLQGCLLVRRLQKVCCTDSKHAGVAPQPPRC